MLYYNFRGQEQFIYSNFLVDNSEVKTFEFDINNVNPKFNEEIEEVKSMNYTGGYQIVDFKDINLSTSEVKIDGVYKTIESNNRKPLLLHRGTVNGVERADCFAFATVEDSKFNLYYGNPKYYIEVTAEDMVKLVVIE